MGQRPSIQRLRQIYERQVPAQFGRDYIPSTFATREEAPSKSRPARIYWPKNNRLLHSLSKPETNSILLAIYNPNLAEMHEQKMLSCWPSPHPLIGFLGKYDQEAPSVLGTINVAERLGYGDIHPIVYMEDPDNHGQKVSVAYPFQGDLLLFIREENGNVYCVNWTVKNKLKSFYDLSVDDNWTGSDKQKRKAYARYEIEKCYYEDAEIRTQKVTDEEIDKHLSANLSLIYPYSCINTTLSRKEYHYIVESFQNCLELKIPPSDIITSLIYRRICNFEEARNVFYGAIWGRKLRVDLFKPILIDRPLNPEKVDILEFYHEWFKK